MQALDDETEIIHGEGFSKAIDITYEGVPEATILLRNDRLPKWL